MCFFSCFGDNDSDKASTAQLSTLYAPTANTNNGPEQKRKEPSAVTPSVHHTIQPSVISSNAVMIRIH